MSAGWIERLTGSLEDKKRYRQYKARTGQLPDGHRTAVAGVERYLMYFGPTDDGLLPMLDDLLDLFEQSAAGGTSVRTVVGDDPVEFAETFMRNYGEGGWVGKERARLNESVDRAVAVERGER